LKKLDNAGMLIDSLQGYYALSQTVFNLPSAICFKKEGARLKYLCQSLKSDVVLVILSICLMRAGLIKLAGQRWGECSMNINDIKEACPAFIGHLIY
jgi:hypothetical protein